MNKRIIIDERWLRMAAWGGISLVVLAIAIGGTRYLVENGPEAPKEKPQVVFETVEVQPVEVVTLDLILPSQGEVVPRKRTTLTAEVRGKLTFVDPRFEAGETFEAGKEARGGDRVLEIDRSDYEAALATAEATVAEAELALVMEEVRKEQGLRDWAKLGNGREPTELVKRVPQILSAKKGVAAAVASRNKAMRDLERTEIRVPYDCA
jgi:hypothetical protein